MILAFLMSTLAGSLGVLQAGLNKIVGDHLGFPLALVLNGVFFLFFNLIFFLFMLGNKSSGGEFGIHWGFAELKWWWMLPGFTGFVLVLGLALSVSRIGAVQTFVIALVAQTFASIAWDIWVREDSIHALRWMGALVAVGGGILATLF